MYDVMHDMLPGAFIDWVARQIGTYTDALRTCRASMYAEKDHMKGVSENIILGQLVPMGTGSFDLMLDDTKLQDAIEVVRPLASKMLGSAISCSIGC